MTRMRGVMQRISSADGAAASADGTTTEHDDDSVDERGRYDELQTATVRFLATTVPLTINSNKMKETKEKAKSRQVIIT
jgi:hypothetical protein